MSKEMIRRNVAYNKVLFREMLVGMSPHDQGGRSHCDMRIVIKTIIDTFSALGYNKTEALEVLLEFFPDNWRVYCLPNEYFNIPEGDEFILNLEYVVSFQELLDSLPESLRDTVKDKLFYRYLYVIGMMNRYGSQAKNPIATLNRFPESRTNDPNEQYIAGFELKDVTKTDDPSKINFHGQNTSQWITAGCIMVQGNEVSIHT